MAQGKEWKKEQREEIIQSLRPYLEMGFSRNKACQFIGLPPQTLSNWVQIDKALGMKLTGWENVITTIALNNIGDTIRAEAENELDTKKENSWKWGERKLKELSPKQETEITNPDGNLKTIIINKNVTSDD